MNFCRHCRDAGALGICNVNALHNQVIDTPGEGVEFAAREEGTGIIQGIEHPGFPFVIGVQWHPEYMIQVKRQRSIFKNLVKQAQGQFVRNH